ncbi:MAG: ABC transporter substrate-binding protein [Burkholderiales bacterium]
MTALPRRRLLLAASALFAAPLARAQRKVYRVGALFGPPRSGVEHLVAAFEEGAAAHGYSIGKDLLPEYRFADGNLNRIADLIHDLLRSGVHILVTGTNPWTRAAMAATRDVPIVVWVGTDVVGQGLVASLSKPGGNVTGLTWDVGGEVIAKRLQLLRDAMPRISRVAGVFDGPNEEAPSFRNEMQKAAAALGLSLSWLRVPDDLDRVFAAALREGADAMFLTGGAWMFARRAQIVALAARHRLPVSYYDAAFVDSGGFMSYAPNLPGLIRGTWKYIDRIIKGAKPGDLPIERPTQLELVINLKAARALGVEMPKSLVLRADRVVE